MSMVRQPRRHCPHFTPSAGFLRGCRMGYALIGRGVHPEHEFKRIGQGTVALQEPVAERTK